MDFYLSFNNGEEQLRLPVTPSSFQLTEKHNNTVLNITNLGEINMIGKKGLASMSLTSFFPYKPYYFCTYTDFPKPYECIKMLKKWKDSGKPIRLIITNTPINYAMTIEGLTYGEQDGTRDVYFTLELREYVFVQQTKPIQVTTSNGTKLTVPSTKRESKPIPKEYKVQKDDTIYTVAKKTTGSMSNSKAIARTNKIGPYKGVDFDGRRVLLI